MSQSFVETSSQIPAWFSEPDYSHIVQFYPFDSVLISSLGQFVDGGLKNNEPCIVIATRPHLDNLAELLHTGSSKVDEHYTALDASEILASITVDGMPDERLFFSVVGGMVEKAARRGGRVRAFGEMVALSWKDGNRQAVIRLETLWNELMDMYPLSLCCAYPRIYFDRNIHEEVLAEICECHNLITPTYNKNVSPATSSRL